MIVPMKKVSRMIMGDKKKETLKKLRKLGILHIEITEGSGKKIEETKEQISLIESAIFSVSEKKNKNIEMKEASKDEVLAISKEVYSLTYFFFSIIFSFSFMKTWGPLVRSEA